MRYLRIGKTHLAEYEVGGVAERQRMVSSRKLLVSTGMGEGIIIYKTLLVGDGDVFHGSASHYLVEDDFAFSDMLAPHLLVLRELFV